MQFVRKYQRELVLGFILLFLYLITRLLFLSTYLPIFTDEAIYIRWAQVALHDANWRFISLTDGKQPLFIWIMMVFLKLIHDPLLAGRMVSVASGLFSCIGLYLLSFELFRKKEVSFISVTLYIFYPLALLHDRLAIYDSMTAMWYIWSLYFSLRLLRLPTLLRSYHLGFVLAASVLTKSGGFISMALLPFLLVLFDWKKAHLTKRLVHTIFYAIIAAVIGEIAYLMLHLSPLFGMIDEKNAVFIYPLHDWLAQDWAWRWAIFYDNSKHLLQWFGIYLNALYIVFLLVGLFLRRYWKEYSILIAYFVLPFVFSAVFGKVLFPRYILFMTVVLLPIIGLGISHTAQLLHKHAKQWSQMQTLSLLTCITLLPTAYVCALLITNPVAAPIPGNDHSQYMTDWPSGWGVQEAVSYLQDKSAHQQVFLGTQGTFGLTPAAFDLYFFNNPNIRTKGYWPIGETVPPDLLAKARQMPTYVYFYEPCVTCQSLGVPPVGWHVVPVVSTEKFNNHIHATLYQVLPQ